MSTFKFSVGSKKFHEAFQRYLMTTHSSKDDTIEAFVLFNSAEDLESFTSEYSPDNSIGNNDGSSHFGDKNNKVELFFSFSTLPCALLKASIATCEKLAERTDVKMIDGDYPAFLSSLNIAAELEINEIHESLLGPTGKNTTIAILDSGIDHKMVNNSQFIKSFNLTDEEDGDYCGHGTALASLLLGSDINKHSNGRFHEQIAGICPNAEIIDLKISDRSGRISSADIMMGLEFLKKQKVDIVLIGATTSVATDGNDILSLFCREIAQQNKIIICPAGNFGPDPRTIGTPGCSNDVFTIGAIDERQRVAFFSSRGPTSDNHIKPDFVMHGARVGVVFSDQHVLGSYKRDIAGPAPLSGTCISATIFAGIIALLKEIKKDACAADIKNLIEDATISQFYTSYSEGNGFLDSTRFLKKFDAVLKKPPKFSNLMRFSALLSMTFFTVFCLLSLVSFLL